MNFRKVEEYIKRLKRREVFLENRIGDKDEEKSHYDRAELEAITWMVAYVEDTILDASDHLTKWFGVQNVN